MADVTQSAALVAAGAGLVAAVIGGANLALSFARERPAIAVFIRDWAADRQGFERYITVVATNVGRRQNTVVSMGLRLKSEGRTWRVDDGQATPTLPAKLEDGATVMMTWLRDELGPEFHDGKATLAGCFAVDGHGREVTGRAQPSP